MTVREYIGARYVPKFIGEWDSTVSYEPLSIVSYHGDSYTSRQYVPVGTPIDNEAFWALTGNFNSQIETYRNEVMEFDGRLDDIENELPIMQQDIEIGVNAAQHAVNVAAAASTPEIVSSTDEMTDHDKVYILRSNGHLYYYTTEWVDSGIVYGSNSQSALYFAGVAGNSSYDTILPDANNAGLNTVYFVNSTADATAPAHMPVSMTVGSPFMLITYGQTGYLHLQECIQMGGTTGYGVNKSFNIWYRTLSSTNQVVKDWFSPTNTLVNEIQPIQSNPRLTKSICGVTAVGNSNYQTALPDCNNAELNTFYFINSTADATAPANLPISVEQITPSMLFTVGIPGYLKLQLCIPTGSIDISVANKYVPYWRLLSGTSQFSPWMSVTGNLIDLVNTMKSNTRPVVIADKSATPDLSSLVFNSLYSAMKYAYLNRCDVRVLPGTYDLKAEYIAAEGQSAYDNINNWTGCPLGHGMKVFFDAESYVVLSNTVTHPTPTIENEPIASNFSPFIALVGGYEIHGLNCRAENARYVIHDAGTYEDDSACKHVIENCDMYIDNTELGMFNQVIGGGLLTGGFHVEIKDCILESEGMSDGSGAITYHNVSVMESGSAYNTYDIHGNYLRTGTVQARKHGVQTEVSPFRVHGNRLNANPSISYETLDDHTDNMELLAWNNVIE